MSSDSRVITARLLPRKKSWACSTSRSYSPWLTRSTQGALQRLIWCSMQGRERLSNTLSEQERSKNAFCRLLTVRLTAQAEAKGPK